MSKFDKGVLYIVFGSAYITEALKSIESLRQHMPHVNVAVFSDEPVSRPKDPNYVNQLVSPAHIRAKIDYLSDSPFDLTLYLDSDTLISSSLDDVFDLLRKYDIVGTHDLARKRSNVAKLIPEYDSIPYGFSEINGGVLGYRKSELTRAWLALWVHYFYKYRTDSKGWDQPALRVSLWESGASLYVLPPEFNVRSYANRRKQRKYRSVYGRNHLAPRIYHLHHSPRVSKGQFPIKWLPLLKMVVRMKARKP